LECCHLADYDPSIYKKCIKTVIFSYGMYIAMS
jgi:hypothetical protein